jgi:multidrug efflux pump subunit AcrB
VSEQVRHDLLLHSVGGNSYRWLQAHQRSILFFLLVLAVAGLVDAYRLPIALFPNTDFPRVVLNLNSGDRPAEQMEIQVTVPVEDAIRRVPGVRNVRSTTSRGSAEVSITFAWGTDMAMATVQIAASVNQIMPLLPANTQLLTRRMDPTVFPMLAYSLTDKKLNPTELYDLAQYQLRPLLSSVEGVARVQITGGAPQEYRVTIDPAKLGSYGLAISDVSTALAAANVLSAVGRLEDHYKLYLLIADNRLSDLDSLRNIVIKTGNNGLVRLSDIATISNGAVPQWIKVTADGKDAVLLNIYQQPGSNSVQIAQDVKARLAEYQSHLPASVKMAQWYDQSQLVIDSATSVRDAIFIGI